jgi:O-antigen/teichoic acid export membrane protein
MSISRNINRGFWTILDQAIVSAGTFLVNVLLARHLPPADYGIFSLLYSGLLTLQLFNATLLIYPLSIRLVTATDEQHAHLLVTALVLVGLLTVGLSAVLALVLLSFGKADLVAPAVACFLLWQIQESIRRGLFTRFRHRVAALGDAVSYIGQVVVVVLLLWGKSLTIESALYAMAATSAAAAIFQSLQVELKTDRRLDLRQAAVDCWSGGGGQALATGLLAQARSAVFPWALAIASGPAAAAAFQAVSNIINVSNPLMIGLGNVVPQAAAESIGKGNDNAWRIVRSYMLLAIPIILGYSFIVSLNPEFVLRLLYGPTSGYLTLATPVRLLLAANILGFLCEFIIWFCHGVRLVRFALVINIVGFAASLFLMLPLVGSLGVNGGCIALLSANAIRLIFGAALLSRILRVDNDPKIGEHLRTGS